MQISKFRNASIQMFVDAAGADGNLSATDAKKLGTFAAAKIAELRAGNTRKKVSAHEAVSFVVGDRFGFELPKASQRPNLGSEWAATETGKDTGDISKTEIKAFSDLAAKALAENIYAYAETSYAKPIPAPTDKKTIQSAGKLLEQLVGALDNEDEVLTIAELDKIQWANDDRSSAMRDHPQFDGVTYDALSAAIHKMKSAADRSVTGIQAGIREAVAELVARDANGDGKFTGTELKFQKTRLAEVLLVFSAAHGKKKLADFPFEKPEGKIYVPTRPFRAPSGGSAGEFVDALVKHFNAFSNDNGGGYSGSDTTRIVMGAVETNAVVKEIEKLSPTRAREVLTALSGRILQGDYRGDGWNPKRIWIQPSAVGQVEALAERLGVNKSFRGAAAAPSYDYY